MSGGPAAVFERAYSVGRRASARLARARASRAFFRRIRSCFHLTVDLAPRPIRATLSGCPRPGRRTLGAQVLMNAIAESMKRKS